VNKTSINHFDWGFLLYAQKNKGFSIATLFIVRYLSGLPDTK